VNRNTVVILHDRVPPNAPADQQDALIQTGSVATALRSLGFIPVQMSFDPDLPATARALRELDPVGVFNLVESIGGTGRLAPIAPAWIEALGIPYTGASPAAIFLTTEKLLSKRWMARNDIPCPGNHVEADATDGQSLWIVKSRNEDASIGLEAASVVPGSQVDARLEECKSRFGGDWFAERYIEGREFNLALLQMPDGVRVLPAAEITFGQFPTGIPRIVDYAAKWDPESVAYRNTARRFPNAAAESGLIETLRSLALKCWDLFELCGYARVDFRVDDRGLPWVLEVNANPCLAPDAGFAAALTEAGVSFDEAVSAIMTAAGVPTAKA
jgi:D-alanine-D-alanine ligase